MAVSSVILGSRERASVLECGSPLPLFHRMPAAVSGATAPPILNMLQLLSPLPACCAVAQRRRTGDGRGEISPEQSRIAPMNQNAMFLPGRGNSFPLSPGVRAGVKPIIPAAFIRAVPCDYTHLTHPVQGGEEHVAVLAATIYRYTP